MQLEYTLTQDDIVNFYYHYGWASPQKKTYRLKLYARTFFAPLMGALFVFIIRKPDDPLKFFLIMIVMVIIIGVLMIYYTINVKYKNKLLKLAADPNNESLYLKSRLTINDQGLSVSDERTESKYKWTAFVKKEETSDYFYLHVSSVQVIVIPKKIMSERDLKEIQTLLQRNLSLQAEFNEVYNQNQRN